MRLAFPIYLLGATVLAITSCSERPTQTHLPVVSEPNRGALEEAAGLSPADVAWAEVIAGVPPLRRGENEPAAEYFLRNWDADLDSFRERGSEFWHQFPDDERRYLWLVSTVGMPPSYALDTSEWAQRELELGVNDTEIDGARHQGWRQQYGAYRRAYMTYYASDEVARRSLHSTELRQRLLDIGRMRARGEGTPATDEVFAEVLQLIEEFPEPVDATERNAHIWHLMSPAMLALARTDILSASKEQRIAFIRELAGSDSSYVRWRAELALSEGSFRSGGWESAVDAALAELCGPTECADWNEHVASLPEEFTFEGVLHTAIRFPARNQIGDPSEWAMLFHDQTIGSLKYRQIGIANWSRMTLEDRIDWYARAGITAPLLTHNVVDLVYHDQGNNYWERIDSFDWMLQDEIDRQLYDIGERLASDPRLSVSQRALVLGITLRLKTRRVQREWWQRRDADRVRDLLDLAIELDQEYSSIEEIDSFIEYLVTVLLTERYEFWGSGRLERIELQNFLDRLKNSSNERVRNIANAALQPVQLEIGTPVRIEAKTMSGEPFHTGSLMGKIVLIDHWDTNCAPCIAAFPGIHETYLEYRDVGFEVVSIAYDGTSQRRSVKRIKERMGLTWTTLDGEGFWGSVAARYGYPGYPQYMLLDREGRWVAGTEQMDNGANLEALLEEMLATEAAEKEASTVH